MLVQRLTELRKQRGWSQQETADQLGIAKSTYAGYESGYRRPSLEAITQLADFFNTTVDYLIGQSDEAGSAIDLSSEGTVFSVDGIPLTEDEVHQLIAFVRVKRSFSSIEN